MSISKIIFVALLLSPALFAFAPGEDKSYKTVQLSDNKYIFETVIPHSWKWDLDAGTEQNIEATTYPEGSNFNNSQVVMYMNIVPKRHGKSLDEFVSQDVDEFRKLYEDLSIEELPAKQMHNEKAAEVRVFKSVKHSEYEKVLYSEEGQGAIVLVLAAKNEEAFNNNLKNFSRFTEFKISSQTIEKQKK